MPEEPFGLNMTFIQPLRELGLTHASRVMPVLRWSEAESFTVIRAPVLKVRAWPNLPEADQVALLIVPTLLLPEMSAVAMPAPSSKPYAATKPLGGVSPTMMFKFVAALELVPSETR